MKIAFYPCEPTITSGGAFSFINSIKNEILLSNTEYEFCFLYYNENNKQNFINNDIKYINTYKKISLFSRIYNKIKKYICNTNINYIDKLIKKENIDLICVLGTYMLDTSYPFIFIVWDLGHRVLPCFPEVTKNGEWDSRENTLKKMLFRATYIITGNEHGKREILENYNVNNKKIHIIPFPIPSYNLENTDSTTIFNINQPFIFYPAQFWPHKNHISIIEAIALLRDNKNIIINCYFTGKDYGNLKYIKYQIKKYNLDNQIHILGFVDQPTLIYLYKNALAMTYVSLLGPNNIPPLEAIVLGCPLIYSNIPGHLEQMENTGIPVNALNPEEICEAIYSLYINKNYRDKIITDEMNFSNKYLTYSYLNNLKILFNDFKKYIRTWKNI